MGEGLKSLNGGEEGRQDLLTSRRVTFTLMHSVQSW